MAGSCIYRSPRCNPPLGGEDELAESLPGAPIKDSNTLIPSPVVFWVQNPAPTPATTLALFSSIYTNVNLQKATKLALKSFIQDQSHTQRVASAA